jgi:creatinine amidohydrolase
MTDAVVPAGAGRSRWWAELSAPVLRAILAADPDTVGLLPIGATEQHGPHLPNGTDTIIATALCEEVSAATGAVILPSLPLGASWWHGTALGGTLALAGEEVAALVVTTAGWATHSGLRRLLVVNGHVGNAPALSLACDRLRVELPGLRVGVIEWWHLDATIAAEVEADALDWHANRAETALMLAIAPHLVDLAAAVDADDEDRTADLVFRYTVAAVSRTGVTGRPSEATPAQGQALWQRVRDAATKIVERARTERPPLS